MKVVMWADAFQMIVAVLGLFFVLFKTIDTVGGFENVIESNWKSGRLDIFKLVYGLLLFI
jgi:hypothetical protein